MTIIDCRRRRDDVAQLLPYKIGQHQFVNTDTSIIQAEYFSYWIQDYTTLMLQNKCCDITQTPIKLPLIDSRIDSIILYTIYLVPKPFGFFFKIVPISKTSTNSICNSPYQIVVVDFSGSISISTKTATMTRQNGLHKHEHNHAILYIAPRHYSLIRLTYKSTNTHTHNRLRTTLFAQGVPFPISTFPSSVRECSTLFPHDVKRDLIAPASLSSPSIKMGWIRKTLFGCLSQYQPQSYSARARVYIR